MQQHGVHHADDESDVASQTPTTSWDLVSNPASVESFCHVDLSLDDDLTDNDGDASSVCSDALTVIYEEAQEVEAYDDESALRDALRESRLEAARREATLAERARDAWRVQYQHAHHPSVESSLSCVKSSPRAMPPAAVSSADPPRRPAPRAASSRRRPALRVCWAQAYVLSCVAVIAEVGVVRSPQYSHAYYVCWAVLFASFLFLLPTVLPTDNSNIYVALSVLTLNSSAAAVFLCNRAVAKWRDCSLNRQDVDGLVTLAAWNATYWTIHCALAVAGVAALASFVLRLRPHAALDAFWRSAGAYLVVAALVSAVDLCVSSRAGKYTRPEFASALRWNVALTLEVAAIGACLCSTRFKCAMWRFAAIRVR